MRRAFSLIELLIATALSGIIVTGAWSALRMATQTMTTARKLSVANELIEEGIHQAFDEADWWDAYDPRAGAPGARRLRQSIALPVPTIEPVQPTLGLPFAPLRRTVDGAPPVWPATGYGLGFQDDERLWAASADNELAWWPGNKGETLETDVRFGMYQIFGLSRLPNETSIPIDGGTSSTVGAWHPRNGGGLYGTLSLPTEPNPPTPAAPETASADPALTTYRHAAPGWFYNQMHGLGDALGWYGMLDYLPANAIVAYSEPHRPIPGDWDWTAAPGDCNDTGGRPIYQIKTFAKADGSWQFVDKPWFVLQSFSPNWAPHGLDFLSSYSVYSLIPVVGNQFETANGALTTSQLSFYNRDMARLETTDMPLNSVTSAAMNDFDEDRYDDAADNFGPAAMNAFVARTTASTEVLPLRPTAWPRVGMSVGRYLRLCRFSNQFAISWTDPVTGDRADLRFTAMGTTLRGARRQRGLDQ